jgi:hypothetical protein
VQVLEGIPLPDRDRIRQKILLAARPFDHGPPGQQQEAPAWFTSS